MTEKTQQIIFVIIAVIISVALSQVINAHYLDANKKNKPPNYGDTPKMKMVTLHDIYPKTITEVYNPNGSLKSIMISTPEKLIFGEPKATKDGELWPSWESQECAGYPNLDRGCLSCHNADRTLRGGGK